MRIVTESLKRLYEKGCLTKEKVKERVTRGTITAEEYAYITGVKYDTEAQEDETSK